MKIKFFTCVVALVALLAAIMPAGIAEDSQNASATTNQSINETNNAAENLITVGGVDHLVVQNVYRTSVRDYWALRLS